MTTSSNQSRTDSIEANDECSGSPANTNLQTSGLDNNLSSATNKPIFVFDASSQQFIDSMKYTDLTLSVEHPAFANSVEISCHKFMLAKKVRLVVNKEDQCGC